MWQIWASFRLWKLSIFRTKVLNVTKLCQSSIEISKMQTPDFWAFRFVKSRYGRQFAPFFTTCFLPLSAFGIVRPMCRCAIGQPRNRSLWPKDDNFGRFPKIFLPASEKKLTNLTRIVGFSSWNWISRRKTNRITWLKTGRSSCHYTFYASLILGVNNCDTCQTECFSARKSEPGEKPCGMRPMRPVGAGGMYRLQYILYSQYYMWIIRG